MLPPRGAHALGADAAPARARPFKAGRAADQGRGRIARQLRHALRARRVRLGLVRLGLGLG